MTATRQGVTARGVAPRTSIRPNELTVLYDQNCPVCRQARRWVESNRQLVPVRFVPAGSDEARRRFPRLDVGSTLAEVTVVADDGAVLRGDRAWTAVLWAVARTRALAVGLARGRGRWRLRGVMGATDAVRRLTGTTDSTGSRSAVVAPPPQPPPPFARPLVHQPPPPRVSPPASGCVACQPE